MAFECIWVCTIVQKPPDDWENCGNRTSASILAHQRVQVAHWWWLIIVNAFSANFGCIGRVEHLNNWARYHETGCKSLANHVSSRSMRIEKADIPLCLLGVWISVALTLHSFDPAQEKRSMTFHQRNHMIQNKKMQQNVEILIRFVCFLKT